MKQNKHIEVKDAQCIALDLQLRQLCSNPSADILKLVIYRTPHINPVHLAE